MLRSLCVSSATLVAVAVAVLGAGLLLVPVATFPEEEVGELVRAYYHSSDRSYVDPSCLLCGKTVVVTGSTSGLGESIARRLYKMGATVIVASRSEAKCLTTVSSIQRECPGARGMLVARGLDLSDLTSVQAFVDWFTPQFKELHALVNNGAINYITNGAISTMESPLQSKQGYDLAFASNYLGHFLLTDLLLPVLRKTPGARVVQISSNSQYMVDGSDLLPPSAEEAPPAAAVDRGNRSHWSRAYGNSKLAQMLHAKEIQKRLDKDLSTDLKVLSVSPGVTNTGMIPSNFIFKKILSKVFYSSDAASYSTFIALFSRNVRGGEYIHNSPSLLFDTTFGKLLFSACDLVEAGGSGPLSTIAPIVTGIMFSLQCVYQQVHYKEVTYSSPNKACAENDVLSSRLYEWTSRELLAYRK